MLTVISFLAILMRYQTPTVKNNINLFQNNL